jgi:hypothetical protein
VLPGDTADSSVSFDRFQMAQIIVVYANVWRWKVQVVDQYPWGFANKTEQRRNGMKVRNAMLLGTAILMCILVGLAGGVQARSNGGSQSSAASSQDNKQITDQDIELLRKDLRSQKKQMVAANLKLTDVQATKFWPVYDQYVAELTKINDEKYALIKEYANTWGKITDAQAESLTKRALAVDEQVAQLRIRFFPMFQKVLPGALMATYFQVDRRIQMMVDLQLMSQIPLLQSQ